MNRTRHFQMGVLSVRGNFIQLPQCFIKSSFKFMANISGRALLYHSITPLKTNKSPLKNGGTGERLPFRLQLGAGFQGRAVKLWECKKKLSTLFGAPWASDTR